MRPLNTPVTETELAGRLQAPRVTPGQIDNTIINEFYFTAADGVDGAGIAHARAEAPDFSYTLIPLEDDIDIQDTPLAPLGLVTFCVLVLENGFTVHGTSACADPANYNKNIGQRIAREDAVNKMWTLLGYELKTKLYLDNLAFSAVGQAILTSNSPQGADEATAGQPKGLAPEPQAIGDKGPSGALQATDDGARNDTDDITIAKACHEANRAYCEALGDHSQMPWEDAPAWQKSSAIIGVNFILNNPMASPSDSHESWLQEKTLDGWIYGEVKDPEAKTHPCFLPYDKLPLEHQAKDHIFRAIVRSLGRSYGLV